MFEGQFVDRAGTTVSPGGYEFGIQGWSYSSPVPRSITFFLDNTCAVTDQYGRYIRRAILPDNREVRFADCPPDASKDGPTVPRPQYATHAQAIEALEAEKIDWQSYEVTYLHSSGNRRTEVGLTKEKAQERQRKLIEGGTRDAQIVRTVAFAGWPQLPYEKLKQLKELPPTPISDLHRILDPALREDALRMREEADDASGTKARGDYRVAADGKDAD